MVDCMVDRVCMQRVISTGVIDVHAEEWAGAIVSLGTKVGARSAASPSTPPPPPRVRTRSPALTALHVAPPTPPHRPQFS